MDLINLYTQSRSSFQSQIDSVNQVMSNFENDPQLHVSAKKLQFQTLVLLNWMPNCQNYSVVTKVTINFQLNILNIICSFLRNQDMFSINMQNHRILMTRFCLNVNSYLKHLNIRINPNSGELNLFKHFYNISNQTYTQILEIISSTLSDLKFNPSVLFKNFSDFLTSDQEDCKIKQRYEKQINNLFIYIQSSDKYAWMTLNEETKLLDSYKNLPRDYKQKIHRKKVSPKQYMKYIYLLELQDKTIDFKLNSTRQDQELQRLLSDLSFKGKGQLLTELKVNDQILKKYKGLKKFELQVLTQEGQHNLLFESFKENPQVLQYEKKILQKLKLNENIGIPRYFFSKNSQFLYYRITNIGKSISYTNYIQSNKKTISLGTKIFILGQITITLIYLKNNQIVYANLIPHNIRIKNRLLIKLIDFTKAYNLDIDQSQFTPDRTKLDSPYLISPEKIRYKSEKYDSYSLCILLYEAIFSQSILYILPSKRWMYELKINSNLNKKIILAREKFPNYGHDKLMKLLGHFTLKCTQIRQKQVWNKKIPYLDWMFIILKQVIMIFSN